MGYKKDNGKKIPMKFSSKNQFLFNLKRSLKNNKKFVLIASDPANFEKNDKLLSLDIVALKLSGIIFEENFVLDNRNKNNISKVLEDVSLIFLCGGDTFVQNNFFNDIKLKDYIKDLNCTIVGISAGAINLALDVFNSPEEVSDLINPSIMVGLGLTEYNIEPHFNINNDNTIQKTAILDESYKRVIYGIPDGSYIKDNTVYGECYKIYQGNIEQICNDSEVVKLN